jgi:hypothetical protein
MQVGPSAFPVKSKLNLPLVIGIAMLLCGFLLANYAGPAIYGSLSEIRAPSTQTDNPVFAVPIYFVKLLLQAAGPLLVIILGALMAVSGAVASLVGLVQIILRWFRRRRGTPESKE